MVAVDFQSTENVEERPRPGATHERVGVFQSSLRDGFLDST